MIDDYKVLQSFYPVKEEKERSVSVHYIFATRVHFSATNLCIILTLKYACPLKSCQFKSVSEKGSQNSYYS